MKVKTIVCLILTWICSMLLGTTSAKISETTIDFEGIDTRHDRVTADAYLWEKFHIRISDVTNGTRVFIVSDTNLYQGGALKASSGHNVLTQGDSLDPIYFTLNFPRPVQSVRFTRPKLIAGVNGITFPEWSAQALDRGGKNLGEPVGEPLGMGPIYYHDVPAKVFTLTGPNIKAVRFQSKNHHFAAFSAVIIDDLTLVTKASK